MTEAIFGLVGVVVGGALTGGLDYLAKRRDERAMARALARSIFADRLSITGSVLPGTR